MHIIYYVLTIKSPTEKKLLIKKIIRKRNTIDVLSCLYKKMSMYKCTRAIQTRIVFGTNEFILVPFLPVTAKSRPRTFWSLCISLKIFGRCGYWESCSEQWHPSHPQTFLELHLASVGDWCWGRKRNPLLSVVPRLDKKEFSARPPDPLPDTHSTHGTLVLGRQNTCNATLH